MICISATKGVNHEKSLDAFNQGRGGGEGEGISR